jgi:hypothetical protein
MAHKLRDQQLNIAGKMLIPLTHAHEVHGIQTFVSIYTIGGTQSVPQNDREGIYAYLPIKGIAQVFSQYYNQVYRAA